MLVTKCPKRAQLARISDSISSEVEEVPRRERFTMETARVYTQHNEFIIDVARIGAYVAEMRAQKGFTDTDYCEVVEVDARGRVTMLINGRGEVISEIEYRD